MLIALFTLLTGILPAGLASTSCPLSAYSGTSLYDNLVVAAVVDVMNAANSGGVAQDPGPLASALFDDTSGLSALNSIPAPNSFLSSNLGTQTSACAVCAYWFYTKVFAVLSAIRFSEGGDLDFPCGGSENSGNTDFKYGGSADPWITAFSGTSLSTLQSFECVSVIQEAIDEFNENCGKNGINVRTGIANKQCAPDDLLQLDATYSVYKTVMDYSVGFSTTLASSMVYEYSRLTCRDCFYAFVAKLEAQKATLSDPSRDCVQAGVFAGGCLASVETAVNDLRVCVGTAYRINTSEVFQMSSDDAFYFDKIIKPYQWLVTCASGLGDELYNDNAPVETAWNKCMMDNYSPLSDIIGYFGNSDTTTLRCYQLLARIAGGGTATPACSTSPFHAACLVTLGTEPNDYYLSGVSSSLDAFFQCSGTPIDVSPTQCDAEEISIITRERLASFIPMVDAAMTATSVIAAAKLVYGLTDLMAIVGDFACSSCFARLAAELHATMTNDDKNLCKNPYASVCEQSVTVSAALTRFETCAGFSLESTSNYACTTTEWGWFSDILPKSTKLVFTSNPFSAMMEKNKMIGQLIANHPHNTFRCKQCLSDLVLELIPLAKTNACIEDVTSGACAAAGALNPFSKFRACAGGYELNIRWTSTESLTSTIVPAETTTTSQVNEISETTTSKGTENIRLIMTAMGILILSLS
jgi:hypothetical protein